VTRVVDGLSRFAWRVPRIALGFLLLVGLLGAVGWLQFQGFAEGGAGLYPLNAIYYHLTPPLGWLALGGAAACIVISVLVRGQPERPARRYLLTAAILTLTLIATLFAEFPALTHTWYELDRTSAEGHVYILTIDVVRINYEAVVYECDWIGLACEGIYRSNTYSDNELFGATLRAGLVFDTFAVQICADSGCNVIATPDSP
jgi:hypothetical protein